MFFRITSDKFLHFMFYYCLFHKEEYNDLIPDIVKVLSYPLGIADEKTLTTFLKLYKKMHQVVNGYMEYKQFIVDSAFNRAVRSEHDRCKDILKALPDLEDKNNKVLQSLKK